MDKIERCYDLLLLERGASEDEVKESWRDLVQVWHPDRFGGNARLQNKAGEMLKKINQAYETLRAEKPWLHPTGARASSGAEFAARYRGAEPAWETSGRNPIDVLRQGVSTWNLWRKKYSDVRPNLAVANLSRLDLSGADLRDADLSGANLQDADLYKANLSGAQMGGARVQRADLSRALMVRANLRGADVSGADFSGADLSGSDLTGCKMLDANLVATNLCGADLAGAVGLTKQQMAFASIDASTRLPSHL